MGRWDRSCQGTHCHIQEFKMKESLLCKAGNMRCTWSPDYLKAQIEWMTSTRTGGRTQKGISSSSREVNYNERLRACRRRSPPAPWYQEDTKFLSWGPPLTEKSQWGWVRDDGPSRSVLLLFPVWKLNLCCFPLLSKYVFLFYLFTLLVPVGLRGLSSIISEKENITWMEKTQFKVVSFHINGIHDLIKRWKVLSKLKKE